MGVHPLHAGRIGDIGEGDEQRPAALAEFDRAPVAGHIARAVRPPPVRAPVDGALAGLVHAAEEGKQVAPAAEIGDNRLALHVRGDAARFGRGDRIHAEKRLVEFRHAGDAGAGPCPVRRFHRDRDLLVVGNLLAAGRERGKKGKDHGSGDEAPCG